MTANLGAPTVDVVVDQWCQLMKSLHNWRLGQHRPWFDSNVTLPQLKAVGLLAGRPSGLSGRELAGLLGVGPSAVTPLVDRLVEHGWARRAEDRADRRITRLFITTEGSAVLERMVAGQRELIASALRQLDPSELEAVAHGFDLVREGVRRAMTTPTETTVPGTSGAAPIRCAAADATTTERIPHA
jgi:DNA-binding MarR family transcriptional regulator